MSYNIAHPSIYLLHRSSLFPALHRCLAPFRDRFPPFLLLPTRKRSSSVLLEYRKRPAGSCVYTEEEDKYKLTVVVRYARGILGTKGSIPGRSDPVEIR